MWLVVFVILILGCGLAALAYLISTRRTIPPQPHELERERGKHAHHLPPLPLP